MEEKRHNHGWAAGPRHLQVSGALREEEVNSHSPVKYSFFPLFLPLGTRYRSKSFLYSPSPRGLLHSVVNSYLRPQNNPEGVLQSRAASWRLVQNPALCCRTMACSAPLPSLLLSTCWQPSPPWALTTQLTSSLRASPFRDSAFGHCQFWILRLQESILWLLKVNCPTANPSSSRSSTVMTLVSAMNDSRWGLIYRKPPPQAP